MFEVAVERYLLDCWQWHSNREFPQVSHDSTHIRADVDERLGWIRSYEFSLLLPDRRDNVAGRVHENVARLAYELDSPLEEGL